ncbi:DUF4097 domain-containing protein [Kitasatospora sp. NBC_00240]|uniref:DUF4097 family beta strand repeat-containing protein n=1 Tax=Kitasatospora sp. NBC_00240 TaxID=2903567 RepID=UPI00224D396D|nr:DUF4097 family beta strand repeat-containing protein [Kitasatospora sp. NBC_00240]MCX5212340.1 DUF4097 domain-containing protein [Kitasatospora sp. NBC_00240]
MKRRVLVRVGSKLAITAAVVGGMSGCLIDDDQERVVVYGVADPVRTLVVQGHTGDIRVTGGGTAVRVTERRTYRGAEPVTTRTTADGTLTLGYRCPDGDCGVGYDIEVPAGTALRVENETGSVALSGLGAEVDVRTGTGDVTASALASRTVRLEARTGGVSVSFSTGPESVRATTRTGDVRVQVPAEGSYAVETATRTGDVKVGVAGDDAAARRITARTETGDVTVADA